MMTGLAARAAEPERVAADDLLLPSRRNDGTARCPCPQVRPNIATGRCGSDFRTLTEDRSTNCLENLLYKDLHFAELSLTKQRDGIFEFIPYVDCEYDAASTTAIGCSDLLNDRGDSLSRKGPLSLLSMMKCGYSPSLHLRPPNSRS